MARQLNLKNGDCYGRLTLLNIHVELTKNGYKGLWKCECGKEKLYINSKVVSGHSNSCGCYRNDRRIIVNTIHGHSSKHNESSEYKTWQSLKDRCLNINNLDYSHYGGRGIIVCDRWKTSFKNFLEDMGTKPNKEYSIERINVNKNYEKSNCKWILKTKQSKNRRNNIFVNLNNTKVCLKEACDSLNLQYAKILYYYRKDKILPNEIKIWD